MLMVYYVLRIAPHEEKQLERVICAIISKKLCRKCFHPMRQMKKKIHGEWIEVSEKLLPGYVFVETEEPEKFYKTLRKIQRLTKMLGKMYNEEVGNLEFTELSQSEVEWLVKIMSCSEDGEVLLSQVKCDENGEFQMVSGPLKYIEDNVVKYDLHKRIAKVELDFKQEKVLIYFGIEIID